jgi:hypothetical protein
MRFLAASILAEPARIAEIPTHYDAEARRVWELSGAGIVREAYFDETERVAYMLLEATNEAHARDALGSLPLTQSAIVAWRLVRLEGLPELGALFARERIAPPSWWPD